MNWKIRLILLSVCILLTGCSTPGKRLVEITTYQDPEAVLELFYERQDAFEKVAKILMVSDAFWESLRLQPGGESLRYIYDTPYEGMVSEDDWNAVCSLFADTGAIDFNMGIHGIMGNDQKTGYISFGYRIIKDSYDIDFVNLFYVEATDGSKIRDGFFPMAFGNMKRLDEHWFIWTPYVSK